MESAFNPSDHGTLKIQAVCTAPFAISAKNTFLYFMLTEGLRTGKKASPWKAGDEERAQQQRAGKHRGVRVEEREGGVGNNPTKLRPRAPHLPSAMGHDCNSSEV